MPMSNHRDYTPPPPPITKSDLQYVWTTNAPANKLTERSGNVYYRSRWLVSVNKVYANAIIDQPSAGKGVSIEAQRNAGYVGIYTLKAA